MTDEVVGRTPLGRLGEADDIAQAMIALMTLDWVTGQVVMADGGLSLYSPIDMFGAAPSAGASCDARSVHDRRPRRACSTTCASAWPAPVGRSIPGNEDWAYGTNRAWLEELVAYWRDGYDWRAHEAAMNRFDHFRVVLDDVPDPLHPPPRRRTGARARSSSPTGGRGRSGTSPR